MIGAGSAGRVPLAQHRLCAVKQRTRMIPTSARPDVEVSQPTSEAVPAAVRSTTSEDGGAAAAAAKPGLASAAVAQPAIAVAIPGPVRHVVLNSRALTPEACGTLIIAASLLALCMRRVRRWIAALICSARSCSTCRGFGVQRCDMCDGAGQVRWDAKWVHTDPCPKCAGKRYCKCGDCDGGIFRRKLFQHLSRNAAIEAGNQAFQTLDPLDKYQD